MRGESRFTRRTLVRYGAAAAALTTVRPARAHAQQACAAPPRFPDGIELYQEDFENWSRELALPGLWTCAPREPADVARLADWALREGWRLRARGLRHNWSPLGPAPGLSCATPYLMVDTTRHLTGSELLADGTARAAAGESIDALMPGLEAAGRGLLATTAPGNVTVAGALAVGAHGTGIPVDGEPPPEGMTFGSLSNLVTAIEVVAWSSRRGRHVIRRVERDDPAARALACHLGGAFVTAVELRTGRDTNLRCRSYTDIPWTELAGSGGRTLDSFLRESGRAEIIWFAHTENPWLKVWSPAPEQPAGTRMTDQPYNYPFSDNIPDELAFLAEDVTRGNAAAAPLLGRMSYEVTHAGLDATQSRDLWGRSKNLLLYIRPTTLRYSDASWAVHCPRAEVQQIVGDFMRDHAARLAEHAARGEHPINGPVNIRVTGVDRPADSGIAGAVAPAFSAARRRRREWDTVLWLSPLSFAGTPGAASFLRETERRLHSLHPGAVMPEWSKQWGFTGAGPWRDLSRIPPLGRSARRSLERLDPGRVFTNPFLDGFLR